MVGGGYVHVNLENPQHLGTDIENIKNQKNINSVKAHEYLGDIDQARIIHAEIDMPEIVDEINMFFEDPESYYNYDDEYNDKY